MSSMNNILVVGRVIKDAKVYEKVRARTRTTGIHAYRGLMQTELQRGNSEYNTEYKEQVADINSE